MRKEQFEEDNFYHIYNRGVDKRPIFLNDDDRTRFIHSLYLFNNFSDIPNRFNVFSLEPKELLTSIQPVVKVVAGCLMPNHYHLVLSPLEKNGISLFLHKIGTSYTKYFNIKHERKGRLFESTFQARHIDRGEYATYLTQYIHLNPVSLYQAKLGTKEVLEEVENYPWSSLADYLGQRSRFTITLNTSFRDEVLDLSPAKYKEMVFESYLDMYQA